jgi:hypothetical protein
LKESVIFLEKEFLNRIKSGESSVRLEEFQETLIDLDYNMDDIHANQSSPTIIPMASGSMNVQVLQPIEKKYSHITT